LNSVKPSDEFFDAFQLILEKTIEDRNKDKLIYKAQLNKEIIEIEKEIQNYINRI
jgi:hypothetical protein